MTVSTWERSLAQRDILLPRLEAAIVSSKWPSSYDVRVDSGPYYGLLEDGSPDGYFHPSTHPLLPARQLYYMFHPDTRDLMVPEKPSMSREMNFAMGHSLHAVIQTQLQMVGICEEEEIEVEYVNEAHHVRGRIDFMVSTGDKPLLGEIKTRTPRLFVKQAAPEPSWVIQMNLGMDGVGVDTGVVIMVESGHPYRMREFTVYRDQAILDAVYTKFDLVRRAIEDNLPPPADCSRVSCPARDVCGCPIG